MVSGGYNELVNGVFNQLITGGGHHLVKSTINGDLYLGKATLWDLWMSFFFIFAMGNPWKSTTEGIKGTRCTQ